MKFGIVGCGTIAGFYASAIEEIEGSHITDVFDVSPQYGEAFAKEQNAVYHSTYQSLLQSNIDTVCICTPSGLHADQVVQASEAGKHVVVEKPIGITMEQLDHISAACKKNSTKLCAISQLFFSESVQKVKKCIDEGRLGKLLLCEVSMKYFRSQEYYLKGGWRGTVAMDGGGALMNQGIHGISLMLLLMGNVKSVSAYTRTLLHNIETEDTAVASMEFENGALGTVIGTTSLNPSSPRTIDIYGSKGHIQLTESQITCWEVEGEERICIRDLDAGASSNPTAFTSDLHRLQLLDFIEAVEQNRRPLLDETAGRKPVELILAIYQASKDHKTIFFNE